jgi:hypothetical protein
MAVAVAVAVGELTCTPLMRRLAEGAIVALDEAAVHHHLGAFGPGTGRRGPRHGSRIRGRVSGSGQSASSRVSTELTVTASGSGSTINCRTTPSSRIAA